MDNMYFVPDVPRADYMRVISHLTDFLNASGKAVTQDQVMAQYQIMPEVVAIKAPLVNGQVNYKFDPRRNSGSNPTQGENRLEQNSLFYAVSSAIHVRKNVPSATNGNTFDGNFLDYTQADPTYFDGPAIAPGVFNEAKCLNTVFDGSLQFQVGSTIVQRKWWVKMNSFQSQAPYLATPLQNPQWGASDEERGFRKNIPNYIVDANADVSINLELSQGDWSNIEGANNTVEAGTKNNVWLRLYGYKIVEGPSSSKLCITK